MRASGPIGARVAGAVAVACLLAGCGGSSPAADPSSLAATAPSSAVPTAAPTPSPSASASSARPAVAVTDPCTVISVSRMSKLAGVSLATAKPSSVSGTKLCVYAPKDPAAADAASVTTQEGGFAGSLEQVVEVLKGQFPGGTVKDATVPGAEAAKVLSSTSGGTHEVDVIAARGGVYYQAIVGGRGDAAAYEAAMTTVVTTLLAG